MLYLYIGDIYEYVLLYMVISTMMDNYDMTMTILWVKQFTKAPMTGNGKTTIYKNGDDWEMVYGFDLPTLLLSRYPLNLWFMN